MDAPAMLKKMKERSPMHHDIPAVIMSSLPESAIKEAANGLYAAFLRKPFTLGAMLAIVNDVLKRP